MLTSLKGKHKYQRNSSSPGARAVVRSILLRWSAARALREAEELMALGLTWRFCGGGDSHVDLLSIQYPLVAILGLCLLDQLETHLPRTSLGTRGSESEVCRI